MTGNQRRGRAAPYRQPCLPSGSRVTPALLAIVISSILSLTALSSPAAAQLRVATYNVARLQGNQTELRLALRSLTEDPQPDTGTIRAPDLIVMQEIQADQPNVMLGWLNDLAVPGVTYALATFTANGGGRENALYYRIDSLVEDPAGHRDIVDHTGPRATDRWKLHLIDQVNEVFYVYGSHFKADRSTLDQAKRFSEADAIRRDSDRLGEGIHILYVGDYNLTSPGEAAYQRFFVDGPGKAVDPKYADNFTDPITHSQSPHDGSAGLVTGGMDDRFDFQLSTEEFNDGLGLSVQVESYRSFGNDGLHFNQPINQGVNTYFRTDEQWKADALAKGSDHLPVTVDHAIPGDPFVLAVDHLAGGFRGFLSVTGAVAREPVYFIHSVTGLGETPVPVLGITLRLDNPALAGKVVADALGEATLEVKVPNAGRGRPVWVQAGQNGIVSDVVFRLIQ